MAQETVTLKRTPLCDNHQKRGARMVDFSGWEMPLQYTKVVAEHQAVRENAGLFDISHMGLVHVAHPDKSVALAFLNHLVPQDLTTLYPGKAVYTQLLNEQGGIIDDIIVYEMPETLHMSAFSQFLVICNAANVDTDLDWMSQHPPHREPKTLTMQSLSDQFCLFALQGPKFEEVLSLAKLNRDNLPDRFHIQEATLGDIPVLLARTGYTGEDGVEIIVSNYHAETLWDRLLSEGQSCGLQPVGLAARDTLRLEAAYPLHGHDIDDKTTPLEAGLGWSVKLKQAGDFIGKLPLVEQKTKGFNKRLYCMTFDTRTIPRQHDEIFMNDKAVGTVTSGSISPTLNQPVAMGYIIADERLNPGDTVQVEIRGKRVDATIVRRPFYQSGL